MFFVLFSYRVPIFRLSGRISNSYPFRISIVLFSQIIKTLLVKPFHLLRRYNAIDSILDKVKAGVKVGTDEYKLADDVDDAAVKAEYGWYSRGQLYLSSTAAAPTTTSSSTDKDTVPKTLPASVYTTLFEDYNKIPIDADRRQFPEKQLVGAEKVLARM